MSTKNGAKQTMLSLSMLAIGGCLVLLILAALVIGIIVIMQSGERDVVSSARQDWIERRSEKDQEGNGIAN
jgi:hypothetical protein